MCIDGKRFNLYSNYRCYNIINEILYGRDFGVFEVSAINILMGVNIWYNVWKEKFL